MHYRAYPTVKDTPNRMTRKRARREVFLENKLAGNRARAERRKEKANAVR